MVVREPDSSCGRITNKSISYDVMSDTEGCETAIAPHTFLLLVAKEFNDNPYTRNIGLF